MRRYPSYEVTVSFTQTGNCKSVCPMVRNPNDLHTSHAILTNSHIHNFGAGRFFSGRSL